MTWVLLGFWSFDLGLAPSSPDFKGERHLWSRREYYGSQECSRAGCFVRSLLVPVHCCCLAVATQWQPPPAQSLAEVRKEDPREGMVDTLEFPEAKQNDSLCLPLPGSGVLCKIQGYLLALPYTFYPFFLGITRHLAAAGSCGQSPVSS